jgi:hypothetical protein
LDKRATRSNINQLQKGQHNASKAKAVAIEQESVQDETKDTT